MSYATPYRGVKVLDLSQGIAGPYCGMLLAQYGAEVVKVEPRAGDWMHGLGAPVGEWSTFSLVYNQGKRSIALDLKSDAGRDTVLDLAERADVVLQSFRPGVADRLGVGYDAIAARNPRAIYVSVSGFGLVGPLAESPCTDTVAQAFSGIMSINRGMDGIPHKVDLTFIDIVTGLYAFQAVSTSLHGRADESHGRHLDVSLLQGAAALQAPKIVEWAVTGGGSPLLNSPAGTYRTSDGWIAVTLVRESQFARLCEAIGEPSLAADPRFGSFADRARHHDDLVACLGEIFATASSASWVERLGAADVLCNAVHDYGEWLAHPQVEATAAAPALEMADGSRVRIPRVPGTPGHDAPPPRVGAHGRDILAELGYDDGRIERLLADGAVFEGPPA